MVIFTKNSGLFYDNNIPGISHSLHTCTSATSCPNDTSQGLYAHLIPTQILGGHPLRMHRNPHIWMQLIPSHHFLQCHSRALSPAPTPGLCSAPSREKPNLGASHLAGTLRKVLPDPPDTKHSTKPFSFSSPASPTSAPHGNPTTEQLLCGAREMLALPSLGAEHHPRSHTHNLGTWDWAKFCALGWLNLQKSSPKQAKLDKFCNICFKPFSFTSKSELIS